MRWWKFITCDVWNIRKQIKRRLNVWYWGLRLYDRPQKSIPTRNAFANNLSMNTMTRHYWALPERTSRVGNVENFVLLIVMTQISCCVTSSAERLFALDAMMPVFLARAAYKCKEVTSKHENSHEHQFWGRYIIGTTKTCSWFTNAFNRSAKKHTREHSFFSFLRHGTHMPYILKKVSSDSCENPSDSFGHALTTPFSMSFGDHHHNNSS